MPNDGINSKVREIQEEYFDSKHRIRNDQLHTNLSQNLENVSQHSYYPQQITTTIYNTNNNFVTEGTVLGK